MIKKITSSTQCPKCGGDIIWLQKESEGEPYRGCRNWIVCDYVESLEHE